jgi:hypothetical protein
VVLLRLSMFGVVVGRSMTLPPGVEGGLAAALVMVVRVLLLLMHRLLLFLM